MCSLVSRIWILRSRSALSAPPAIGGSRLSSASCTCLYTNTHTQREGCQGVYTHVASRGDVRTACCQLFAEKVEQHQDKRGISSQRKASSLVVDLNEAGLDISQQNSAPGALRAAEPPPSDFPLRAAALARALGYSFVWLYIVVVRQSAERSQR